MKDTKSNKFSVQDLREKGLIILEYISGSQLYGTATESSDIDVKGIFVLPDSVYSEFDYNEDWEEVESGKFTIGEKSDQTNLDPKILKFSGKECEMKFYELRKFMRLLMGSNPNILEILDIPEDCLLYKHPCIDILLNNSKKFITKKAYYSFTGYAHQQIQKAKGQNKKQNWEKERFERKTILDFCYVPHEQGSISIKEWIKKYGAEKNNPQIDQSNFGLSKINHMPGCYGIYEEHESCKGMVIDEKNHTMLKISSVPKDAIPLNIMILNESAWNIHCAEYKSYEIWKKEKNEARWIDVQSHGQKIDGKNMLHMKRLIEMSEEIADGKGIISRRNNSEELLKIRKGAIPLQELLDLSIKNMDNIKEKYDKSELPAEISLEECKTIYAQMVSKFRQIDWERIKTLYNWKNKYEQKKDR